MNATYFLAREAVLMFLMRKHIFLTKNVTVTRYGSLSQLLTKSFSPNLYNQCNRILMRPDVLGSLELHLENS